jgi:hypothetical protein
MQCMIDSLNKKKGLKASIKSRIKHKTKERQMNKLEKVQKEKIVLKPVIVGLNIESSTLELSQEKVNGRNEDSGGSRYEALKLSAIFCSFLACICIGSIDVNAAGQAVSVDVIDNASETMREYMKGAASIIIDGMILVGGGWGSVKTSTPAPLIFAIISVMCFEVLVKIIMG